MERSSAIEQPTINIFLLLGSVLIGFAFIGPMIGSMLAIPFFDGGMMEFLEALTNPMGKQGIKIPLIIVQGASTFVGLIVVPLLLLRAQKKSVSYFVKSTTSHSILYLLAAIITISFMVVDSVIIEWNTNLHFPDAFPQFLKNFESWAHTMEDRAAELTSFLTNFENTGQLYMILFIVAVLPAIGEELVFRGLLQPEVQRLTNNPHIAIWVSAIIFSAFHLQFFGFFPRMLLGALFGYFYYWSGSLWVSILAHFVNNAFSVLLLYFYQKGATDLDVNSTESAPIGLVLGATFVTFILLYFFKKQTTSTELS